MNDTHIVAGGGIAIVEIEAFVRISPTNGLILVIDIEDLVPIASRASPDLEPCTVGCIPIANIKALGAVDANLGSRSETRCCTSSRNSPSAVRSGGDLTRLLNDYCIAVTAACCDEARSIATSSYKSVGQEGASQRHGTYEAKRTRPVRLVWNGTRLAYKKGMEE